MSLSIEGNGISNNYNRVDLTKGISSVKHFAEVSGGNLIFPSTNPWDIEYLSGILRGAGKLTDDITDPLDISLYLEYGDRGISCAPAETVLIEGEALLIQAGAVKKDHVHIYRFKDGDFTSSEIPADEASAEIIGLQAIAKQKSLMQLPNRKRKPGED